MAHPPLREDERVDAEQVVPNDTRYREADKRIVAGYEVVEKIGRAAEFARELDPR